MPPTARIRPSTTCRVLGIDTSLRSTGIGLVEWNDGRMRALAHDVVRTPTNRSLSVCLLNLQSKLAAVLTEFRPDVAAIEGLFYARFARTALLLGHARGVAIVTCAQAAIAVHEYEPRRVKQAVVGFGGASKTQIQQMVMSQLGLTRIPPEDAADALAIAICHLHNTQRLRITTAKAL